MKYIYPILAATGLVLLLIPSLMFYFDAMEAERMKLLMFIGTLIWFSGAIPWLGKKKPSPK
jgi:hypothetical protein